MGMSAGAGGGRTTLSEINVTPLVDVMLVLLIIFMVTAPLIQQGVEVDLPKTRAPSMNQDEEKLVLAIDGERRIWLADTEIAFADLEEKLAANERVRRERELYLHADRKLPYEVVLDVMAAAKRAGVDTLGLISDPTGERMIGPSGDPKDRSKDREGDQPTMR